MLSTINGEMVDYIKSTTSYKSYHCWKINTNLFSINIKDISASNHTRRPLSDNKDPKTTRNVLCDHQRPLSQYASYYVELFKFVLGIH